MMKRFLYILVVLLLGSQSSIWAQEESSSERVFSVKVKVIDENTNLPIKNANVSVNGKLFLFSSLKDRYIIKARANDELIVTHPDFDTVYYVIKDDEDIKISVEGIEDKKSKYNFNNLSSPKNKPSKSKRARDKKAPNAFNVYYDSVKFHKEKNLDKSLTFVEKMLDESQTKRRRAVSFKELTSSIFLHNKIFIFICLFNTFF